VYHRWLVTKTIKSQPPGDGKQDEVMRLISGWKCLRFRSSAERKSVAEKTHPKPDAKPDAMSHLGAIQSRKP
jgi:hypothetical protein